MKKRIFSLLMAVMMVCALTACGGEKEESGQEDTKTEAVSDKKEETEEEKKTEEPISMEEQVLVDQDGFKITATGIRKNKEENGYLLDIKVQNDTDVVYGNEFTGCAYVNGYQSDLMDISHRVYEKGEKTDEIRLGSTAFDYIDEGEMKEIRFNNFMICEQELGENYEGEQEYSPKNGLMQPFFQADSISIKTSAYDGELELKMPEGEEIYNENGFHMVKVESKDGPDSDGIIFLKNESGKDVWIEINDLDINGFVISETQMEIAGAFADIPQGLLRADSIMARGFGVSHLLTMSGQDKEDEIESVGCVFRIYDFAEYETQWMKGNPIAEIPYTYTAQ